MKRRAFPIYWKDALEGSKRAIEWAERLGTDAEILEKNGRVETAYYLSLNAWEEVGKAVLLFRHWKEKEDIDENRWFDVFSDHRMKSAAFARNQDILFPKSRPPKTMKQVLEDMKKFSKEQKGYFDLSRQIGLYVDWVGGKEKWRSPATIDKTLWGFPFSSKRMTSFVFFAASHLKELISESTREYSSNP